MKQYGVLIVGTGWVSSAHIAAFEKDPRAKIVAIMSRRAESAEAQIQTHGLTDCHIYTDYAQALADPRVDIVVICTPNDLHCEQAIAAARAGKHLLIEKPAALQWEDAQRMAKEIEAAGVRSLVGYVLHFNGLFETAKNLQEKFFGEIQYAETDISIGSRTTFPAITGTGQRRWAAAHCSPAAATRWTQCAGSCRRTW